MSKDNIFDIDYFNEEKEAKPKKKPAKHPKLASVGEALDMLSACDAIVDIMTDSGLSASALKKAKPYLKFVAEGQQLSEMQAMFLALILNISLEGRTKMEDIAELLDCRNITILRYMSDIDELVKRHFVIKSTKDEDFGTYRVANDVIEALKAGRCYVKEHKTGLTGAKFFYEVSQLLDMRTSKELTYQELVCELKMLMDDNPQVEYVRELRAMKIESDEHIVLMTIFANTYVVEDYTYLRFEDIDAIIPESGGIRAIRRTLSACTHPFIVRGLIRKQSNSGLLYEDIYELTTSTLDSLLNEFYLPIPTKFRQADVITHDAIEERHLFYNHKVCEQTDRLARLMSDENYDAICQRLREKKLRTGFTCLFYGAPGTGKTETALQLARQTGRDVFRVELSQLRNQYVGESEKQVKEVFRRYAKIAEKSKRVPILLFNEADGIINRRTENVQHSVDKMENAIQNIILQEMENFDGILIATTNLTSTLDPAFERRFLYKVNFEKPDLGVRKSIRHDMIPELDEPTLDMLASRYAFSGGQIRNVAAKLAVDSILYGEASATPASLNDYCQQEHIGRASQHIGF